MRSFTRSLSAAALGIVMGLWAPWSALGADHGDAPGVAGDQAVDLADVYFFLDPNDNSKAVVLGHVRGFVTAGENANFGIFDPNVRYRFEFENTGDAVADLAIDVTFSRKVGPEPQIATVVLPVKNGKGKDSNAKGGGKQSVLTFPTTVASVAPVAPEPVVSSAGGIDFSAGLVDDPFFFDIPAFSRFFASARAGAPDPSHFNRGRDSFAGYSVMSIAMRIPVSMLTDGGSVVGLNMLAQRRQEQPRRDGSIRSYGKWRTRDRAGNPGVNVVLIPFPRKDIQNVSTPEDDADGRFVSDILGILALYGTDATSIGILAGAAVVNGDYLRVDTAIPNSGPGGGDNAGAGFPNGRRLRDDVVDTVLTVINNRSPLSDNVSANDVPLRDVFPFVAGAQQPRASGVVDDNTRN